MPKVSAAHLATRRRQILDAARVCFARAGFHPTTMQDIYREASLSPGAVYRYFKSKDDIIEALCEESASHMVDLVSALAAYHSWAEVLDELAAVATRVLTVHACADQHDLSLDIEVWGEALRNRRVGGAVRHTLATQRDLLASLVRRAQDAGEVDPALDAASVAGAALAFLEGMLVQRALLPNVDVRSEVEVARRLLLGLQ
jgi:AcrR family transcriptional regulator